MYPLSSVEDFRGRFSDDRAVLELFQKALKELECAMEGVCMCVHVWVCKYNQYKGMEGVCMCGECEQNGGGNCAR